MAQVSSGGLSKTDLVLLVAAMSAKNKTAAAAPTAQQGSLPSNISLGSDMPGIGFGLAGLANGAMMSGLPGVGSSGFTGGLADRLGISQFFPQGFNPFSGSATSELASMGTSITSMSPYLASSSTAIPSSPAQSKNQSTMAVLALLLSQKEKAKTDETPTT